MSGEVVVEAELTPAALPRGRLVLGTAVFVFGFASPLLIPLVSRTAWPAGLKTALSGFLLVGAPELMMLAAAAVMGKEGFAFLKAKVWARFRPYAPPDQVSAGRYRLGLVMFLAPLFLAWMAPYEPGLFPGYEHNPLPWNIAGDLMLVCSLFVLGGDFWDKLRALIDHRARASFTDPPNSPSPAAKR